MSTTTTFTVATSTTPTPTTMHHVVNQYAISTDGYKAIAMVSLATISTTVGMLTIFIPKIFGKLAFVQRHRAFFSYVITYATCFAGGVFLTVGLTHMLAEATDVLVAYYGPEDSARYRHSYILCMCGYLVLLMLGKMLTPHHHDNPFEDEINAEKQQQRQQRRITPAPTPSSRPRTPKEPSADEAMISVSTVAAAAVPTTVATTTEALDRPQQQGDESRHNTSSSSSNNSRNSIQTVPQSESPAAVGAVSTPTNAAATAPSKVSKAGSIGLVASLVVHATLEGIAGGLQTTQEGVLLIFIAIVVHQWAEDFSISVSTGHAEMSTVSRVLSALAHAFACPVGIGIGWLVQSNVPDGVSGALLSLSSGSFIYIACSEIIPAELEGGDAHDDEDDDDDNEEDDEEGSNVPFGSAIAGDAHREGADEEDPKAAALERRERRRHERFLKQHVCGVSWLPKAVVLHWLRYFFILFGGAFIYVIMTNASY